MAETDRQNPAQPSEVICRPARREDTADVIELTRTIWDGHDYVPEAWEEWLQDKEGYLVVAELAGEVVGLVKLSRLGPGEWWLQGLRVDPAHEGQHIASRLHDHLLGLWETHCGGLLRLTTYRPQVRHLCERTGFAVAAEFSVFISTSLGDRPPHLRRMEPGEVEARCGPALIDDSAPVYSRLIDIDWEWTAATLERLEQAAQEGQAWIGPPGYSVLALREDDEEGEPLAMLSWLMSASGALANDLREFRRLGAQLGYRHVGWAAPLTEEVLQALSTARYRRAWEGSVYLYEKRRPIVDEAAV
jgi:GNAT superfamily N-acetyltransferase